MNTKRLITAFAVVTVAVTGLGFTLNGSGTKVLWTFLHEPYRYNYDGAGIPYEIDENTKPDHAFLERVNKALPERKDIRQTNPHLISDDVGSNVRLVKKAKVYLTFIHEGAGYKNSFGFFTFPDGEPPQSKWDVDEVITFPNSSYYNSGGSSRGLRSGDTMYLGQFDSGTNIGFMLVANGFDSKTGVTTKPTGGPRGGDWVFYTVKALNPEGGKDNSLRAHTVLLNDVVSGKLVLGMEDIRRDTSGCDHDFNDMVFTVHTVPADAVDTGDIPDIPDPDDCDNDGIPDDSDDYPCDEDKTWEMKSDPGTFVFEDSWPLHGDYDYNDLVVGHEFTRILNKAGEVVGIDAVFEVKAHSASEDVGFGLAIPGVSATELGKDSTLQEVGRTPEGIGSESGADDLTVVIFDSVQDLTGKGDSCDTFNTTQNCYSGDGPTFKLHLEFKSPQPAEVVGQAPFDPFLFFTGDRGREVHMAGNAPTDLADMGVFQSGDDDSLSGQDHWYLSFCELPWMMDVPSAWAWPAEGMDILDAYPDFALWAESQGQSNNDWYEVNVRLEETWSH